MREKGQDFVSLPNCRGDSDDPLSPDRYSDVLISTSLVPFLHKSLDFPGKTAQGKQSKISPVHEEDVFV